MISDLWIISWWGDNFYFSGFSKCNECSSRPLCFVKNKVKTVVIDWQFMTTYDSLWQLMTAYDNFWKLEIAYDILRQILTNFDS